MTSLADSDVLKSKAGPPRAKPKGTPRASALSAVKLPFARGKLFFGRRKSLAFKDSGMFRTGVSGDELGRRIQAHTFFRAAQVTGVQGVRCVQDGERRNVRPYFFPGVLTH